MSLLLDMKGELSPPLFMLLPYKNKSESLIYRVILFAPLRPGLESVEKFY
jgi:hypothetical protein